MTLMPPGEHLDGTTAECAHLHLLLACFRASPPPMRLAGGDRRPLPDVLGTGIIDPDVLHRKWKSWRIAILRAIQPAGDVAPGRRQLRGVSATRLRNQLSRLVI
jgi:hypothetical protein